MKVFIFENEVEGGWFRPAKEGETLDDFVKETTSGKNLEFWDGMTYGRGWGEEEWDGSEDYPIPVFDAEPVHPDDLVRDVDDPNVKHLETRSDDDLILMWSLAEVPDDTKYIWYGRAHPDLDGWCGMGGNGYIVLEGYEDVSEDEGEEED